MAQIKILHPLFESVILEIPVAAAGLISTILVALYAADTALSVQSALYLQQKPKMNQIGIIGKLTEKLWINEKH